MPKSMHYNFSVSEGGKQIGFQISVELRERIQVLCNLTEMSQTALCRYIIKRGITEMEQKLVALRDKAAAEEQS